MGARVAEPDQHVAIAEDLLHPVDPRVVGGHRELAGEIVAQRHVEEGVDAVLALGLGDFGDAQPFVLLQVGITDLVQHDAVPVAEAERVLQVLAEGVAEGGVGIDRALRLLRGVGKDPFPGREAGEGEGAAHVDLAGERQG